MSVENNVIHFEPAVWYCMRQCKESIKYLRKLGDPKYDIEIEGEANLLRTFMSETLQKEAA